MSWDEASVWVTNPDGPGHVDRIFGKPGVSAQHPVQPRDGSLACVTDEPDHWNWVVHHCERMSAWRTLHNCSIPVWVSGTPPACVVGDGPLTTVQIADGHGVLALWHPRNGGITHPLPEVATVGSLTSSRQDLFAVAEWDDRPASLVRTPPTGERTELVVSKPLPGLSRPVSRQSEGLTGSVHLWLYPASDAVAILPILILTHGGPTSVHHPSFDRMIQFWVSRGICMSGVSYSGSTGFGCAYQDRLRERWGAPDIADMVTAVRKVCRAELADSERVVIAEGNAGGYTTLQALVTSDLFTVGISSYGIEDLRSFVEETHKTESHYTFVLAAPRSEGEQVYWGRSPIIRPDCLNAPMLILQGLKDRVVSPGQAFDAADAVCAEGLVLALVTFEHGGRDFHSLAAHEQSPEPQASFLEQVFGLPLSDDAPVLPIENFKTQGKRSHSGPARP